MKKVRFALAGEEDTIGGERQDLDDDHDGDENDYKALSQIYKKKQILALEAPQPGQQQSKKRERSLDLTLESKQAVSDEAGNSRSSKRKGHAIIDSCDDSEITALERAEELQTKLGSQFPSFVKLMLPSHVSGGFWLGLPSRFCKIHMPDRDSEMILENERGEEYRSKYLVPKTGLSGGWRGFSIAHELLEGDALVFQLVKPDRFKVYIVRGDGSNDIDEALGLLQLESDSPQLELEVDHANRDLNGHEDSKENDLACFAPSTALEENTSHELLGDGSDEDSGSSEVSEGIRFAESNIEFEEVKCIESFSILVNGLIIDSIFSRHIREKYYKLCCSQNSFLHQNLIGGINCKLAEGIILETIDVADAIRSCTPKTVGEKVGVFDKTLKALEKFGMNVAFLRERLIKLSNLAEKSRRLQAASRERIDCANDLIMSLQAQLLVVKESARKVDAEIEVLKADTEKNEIEFLVEAGAPWLKSNTRNRTNSVQVLFPRKLKLTKSEKIGELEYSP